jgi:hypothetical protein
MSTLEALEEYCKHKFGDDDHFHKLDVFLKVDCGYG